MSINPSKYIKLTTQPWTGDIITDPTGSLTITDPNGGSVTLTEEDGDLLLNGQPIPTSGGTGGVTSIAAVPGSGITVSPLSGTGAVSLSYSSGSGIQSITAGANIQVYQDGTEVTVSLSPNANFVTSIQTGSFEFFGGGRGDVSLNSYASARIPVFTAQIQPNSGQFTTDTFSLSAIAPGVYFAEVIFTRGYINPALYRYNSIFVLLKRTTGLLSCGGTNAPVINVDGNQNDYVRVYNASPLTPSQDITIETHVADFYSPVVAQFELYRIV